MEKENKIVLKNERNGHVNKLVNELGSWGFFKVIYRNDMLKILGMNILMLILFVPVGYLAYRYLIQVSQFTSRLPLATQSASATRRGLASALKFQDSQILPCRSFCCGCWRQAPW